MNLSLESVLVVLKPHHSIVSGLVFISQHFQLSILNVLNFFQFLLVTLNTNQLIFTPIKHCTNQLFCRYPEYNSCSFPCIYISIIHKNLKFTAKYGDSRCLKIHFPVLFSFCITLLFDRHHDTMMMTEKGSIEHLSSLTTVPSICRFRPSISLRTLSPSWAKTVILWLVALISLVVSSS